ncbi:protein SRC2 homolog [Rutidosis leptorrhynchoides]|uniref:protein SRC2 homolog n=1 Tax=Rutidosis leptorrhynchoides TaxID=125765 RepID=UPI003A9A5F58
MECRNLELTINSANDLREVRKLFKMKVYAKVLIGGNKRTKKRTPVDRHGRRNPAWNCFMNFSIAESCLQHHGTMLVIMLYCKRKVGDRYIEVHQSLKQLYDHATPLGGSAVVFYPVRLGSAESQGHLLFSYKFGEKMAIESLIHGDNTALVFINSPGDPA